MRMITVISLRSKGSSDTLHQVGKDKWVRRSRGPGLSCCIFYNEKPVPVGPSRSITLESDLNQLIHEDCRTYGQRLAEGFGEDRWGDDD